MDGQLGKILIVDDDENICEVIKMYLQSSNYDTKVVNNGKIAEEVFLDYKPDLVLLDVMLPGVDGIDVLKWIRKEKETPVIMLTARGETFDKVLALELGADDYVVKPFEPKELVARVKAVMRRYVAVENNSEVSTFGRLKADFEKHNIYMDDKKIDLSLKEFELLEILIKNKGKVLTREMLLDKIWGYEYIGETRTVDVHIRYLRKKIEEDDKNPKYIETIRGVGYRFNPEL